MKKIISVILALSVALCSFAFCASATEGKQYRDYKVYTLLGDSVASGYDDVEKNSSSCQFKYKENGYGFIAEKILEALPDARYCYDDVPYGSEYYNAVYYMYKNGYMSGISATEFGAGENFTAGQLAEALCSISGQTQADAYSWAVEKGLVKADADSELGYFDVMTSLNSFSAHQGKTDFFYRLRLMVFTVKNMFSKLIFGSVKRGDAAKLIYGYCEL